jgi:HAD superfamily hydrolase (TIGR01549 family)
VPEYDAVLFDQDGVLVEPPSREVQVTATRDAFAAAGVESVERRHLDAICEGVTVAELREICGAYGLDPETFWATREHHDERSQLAQFRAGGRTPYDDVAAVADLPGARGVVSNNHHSTVEFVLSFFGLAPLFDTVRGRPKTVESLRLKKPNPHYIERALADLGTDSALYVGDSEHDVEAAHRAGVDSAFVRRPHTRDADLAVAPTHEVESLHALTDVVEN